MQRIELVHSANLIQTSATSAFASSVDRKLLLSQTIDNVSKSSSGDIKIPATPAIPLTATTTVDAAPTTSSLQSSTTTTSVISSIQTSIPVTSTVGFPLSGTIQINSEQMQYTSITATSFDGCLRAANSTIAAGHATSSVVQLTQITSTQTTIPATSTTSFPSSGTIQIDNEYITYTSTTATSFDGCTRGAGGTTAATHAFNLTITQINTITTSQTTIPVASTTGFRTSGTLQIGGEQMTYSAKTASSFTISARGVNGTTASTHTAGDVVKDVDINAISTGPFASATNPVSMLFVSCPTSFYITCTTKTGVTIPLHLTSLFSYNNNADPLTSITMWNGTLSYTAPSTFTIKGSSIDQTATYISAS